jgi:3'-phosphoadenosine 5'-phosphosulfate sulfotransferase (PAPS reductase)/FAD synthetase
MDQDADYLAKFLQKPNGIVHVGISGGKDSTALLLWAVHESGIPKDKLVATFCDTGNEHELTLAYVQMLSEKVFPITTIKPDLDFYELANKKKRFPSARARFCTEDLKMKPSRTFVWNLKDQGKELLLMSGVRAAESLERSKLPQYEWDNYYGLPVYRPLLSWTIQMVWDQHKKYGLTPNPLYAAGMVRVGCYPCIMSRKPELEKIAEMWPERFQALAEKEKLVPSDGNMSTFFARDKVPKRYRSKLIQTKDGTKMYVATSLDVMRWALDGMEQRKQQAINEANQSKLGLEFDMQEEDAPVCPSTFGACE